MKRLRTVMHLVALFLLLAITPASAQVTLGLRAGASASTIALTDFYIDSQESRRGIQLGLSAAVPVSGMVSVALGADYLQRGSTATLLQLGDIEHTSEYLQFSALGSVSVPLAGSPLSLQLLAGPAAAWELSCERRTEFAVQPVTLLTDCDDPMSATSTRALDVGLLGGLGARLSPAGRTVALSLEVIYSHGLRSILESERDTTAKNRAMTVQAGLDFSIG